MIYAGVKGYLDALSLDRIKPFEEGLLSALRAAAP